MESIKAYSNSNAVKVIAFAISLTEELSLENIKILIDKLQNHDSLKENFNKIEIQHVLSMTISPDNTSKQESEIGGIIFHKQNENKNNLWSLIVHRDKIIVTCKEYTRWSQVSENSLEYINIIFNAMNNVKIAQITLEYLDEFEILDTTLDWRTKLFNSLCPYITKNIYDLNDFWNISQGYFIQVAEIDEKILDTIDINYFADESDNLKQKVYIRMQHKLQYSSPITYEKHQIKNYFDKIHNHSKNIFFTIVNEEILNNFHTGE